MLTQLMLIQKINVAGTVDVFLADSGMFNWSFESRRTRLAGDREFFPFQLGAGCRIQSAEPGPETRVERQGEEILFSHDYAIPAGTVIGILFPKAFVPGEVVFKHKPYIPVGQAAPVSLKPPGQIDIFYNVPEKRCAVIFHIHRNTCFGFSCASSQVKNFVKGVKHLKQEMRKEKAVQDIWLRNQEVMHLLQINDRTLMRRRQDGSIPFTGTRGNYLYRKSDIERLLV